MKRTLSFIATAVMVLFLAACGSKNDSSSKADGTAAGTQASDAAVTEAAGAETKAPDAAVTEAPAGTEAADTQAAASADDKPAAEEVLEPGKLVFLNLEEGAAPVIRKLTLSGNCAGSTAFNSRDPAVEGIRCVFELNEWIEFYPETDETYNMKAWFIKHHSDPEYYVKNKPSDLMDGFAQVCDLRLDEEADTKCYGSTYLNYDDFEPGIYDLVLTFDGKAAAAMAVRFYPCEGLSDKSDEELDKLCQELYK